jgi:hypothetical protein
MELTDSSSIAAPAWGEMDTDCLAHVFGRLPLEDLAASAPLVCRGWRRAAADPSLWRALDLRHDHLARFMPWGPLAAAFARRYGVARFTFAGFLNLCLARAGGSVSRLALPPLLSSNPAAELDAVAAGCPSLRRLALPPLLSPADEARLPDLVPNWPLLRHLELESKPSSFPAVAAQLALHCPDFSGLKTSGSIKPEDAAAMAASLPGLRLLCLDSSYLPKQELLAILAGCTRLVEFSARNCVGFSDKDEEVVARGAGIDRFEIGGSRFVDGEMMVGDDECCDSSYVDVM